MIEFDDRITTNKSGIYCIKNIINNKIYIGSASCLNNRKSVHLYKLKNNNHFNSYLQNSYNKYGVNNFKFYIIEFCDNLIEREQYYINTLKPQFNLRLVADRNTNIKHTEETKKIISDKLKLLSRTKQWNKNISNGLKEIGHKPTQEALNKSKEICSKKVYQYDKDNKIIKIFNSLNEAANELNIPKQNISSVCNNKRKSAGNFIFKFN